MHDKGSTINNFDITSETYYSGLNIGNTDAKQSIKSDLLVWCMIQFDTNDGGQS